jgi:hypothetical protein
MHGCNDHSPFLGAIALSGGVFSTSELSIALSFVNCSGDEGRLLNCPGQMSSDCPSMEAAAIVCQGRSVLVLKNVSLCQRIYYVMVYFRVHLSGRCRLHRV